MANARKRQHSFSDDPVSGFRRSAPRAHEQPGAARPVRRPLPVFVSFAVLLLPSMWLWSRPSESNIVATRLPLAAAHTHLPAPPSIALELSAWPPEARLLLDDAPLPANPYRGRIAADPGLHRLRAVAPGLQPQERAITLDRDRALTLRPLSGTPARARSSRVSGRAGAAGAGARAPRLRARAIYEQDPYR